MVFTMNLGPGFLPTIRSKLYFLLLVILVPVLMVQAGYLYVRFKAMRANEFQANLELARAAARTFDEYVKDILHLESAIGVNFTGPQSLSVEQMAEILEADKAKFPSVRNFTWCDARGRVVASSTGQHAGLDLSDRDYMRRIVSGEEQVVSDLLLSRTSGKPIIAIGRGVRDKNGSLLGIIVAGIIPEELGHVLALELSKGGAITVIDRNGMAVYQYPTRQWNWEERNLLKGRPAIREALEGREVIGTFPCFDNGEERMVAMVPSRFAGWAVSTGRSEREVMTPIKSQLFEQSVIFLLLTGAVFLAAFNISSGIADTIQKLRNHILAFGRGEPRQRFDIKGSTELRDLASAFDTMAGELGKRENELRKSEEALRSERARLLSLFDTLPGFLFLLGADYSVRFANRYFRDHFGEAGGKHCYECHEGSGAPCDDCPTMEVLRTEQSNSWEWTHSSSGRTYQTYAYPIVDTDGSDLVQVLGIDITDRKRAEKATRQLSDELKIFFDSVPAAIWYKDKENNYIRVNRAAADLIGSSVEDLEGKSATVLFPDYAENYYRDDLEVIESGRPKIGIIEETQDRSCNIKWVRTDKIPIRDECGSVTGVIAFSIDITDLKLAEQAVRESGRLNELVLESLPHPAMLIKRDRIVVVANRVAREAGALIGGYCWRDYAHGDYIPDEHRRHIRDRGGCIPDGGTKCSFCLADEAFVKGALTNASEVNAFERIWDIWWIPVDDDLFFHYAIDITERKHSEELLRDYAEHLRSLSSRLFRAQEDERKRIAGELHDGLAGSLVAIKMSLENIRKRIEQGESGAELLDIPISWTQHTLDEARRLMSDLRPKSLDDLGLIKTLEWLVREYRGLFPKIEVQEEFGVDESEIPKALKIVLFRIIQEAFNNISKYSQAKSVILSLSKEDSRLNLTIQDNGVGFDPRPLFASHDFSGGFGLASMKERAEFSGGELIVVSSIGEGTRVHASWPLKQLEIRRQQKSTSYLS